MEEMTLMSEQLNIQHSNEKVDKPSLLGIVTSPIETLERIKQQPKVLLPLIIVIIISSLAAYLSVLSVDYSIVEEELGAEGAAYVGAFTTVGALVSGIIGGLITLLISALILFAIVKIAGKQIRFKQMFSMTVFISLVTSIGTLLNAIILYFVGGGDITNQVFTSLNSIVGAEGALGAFLSSIEIFGIWGTILTAFGLHHVGQLSKGASWTISIVLFILGSLLLTLSGATQSLVGA